MHIGDGGVMTGTMIEGLTGDQGVGTRGIEGEIGIGADSGRDGMIGIGTDIGAGMGMVIGAERGIGVGTGQGK